MRTLISIILLASCASQPELSSIEQLEELAAP